eukprot:1196215-Prorocentrum_minimum.AAC.10
MGRQGRFKHIPVKKYILKHFLTHILLLGAGAGGAHRPPSSRRAPQEASMLSMGMGETKLSSSVSPATALMVYTTKLRPSSGGSLMITSADAFASAASAAIQRPARATIRERLLWAAAAILAGARVQQGSLDLRTCQLTNACNAAGRSRASPGGRGAGWASRAGASESGGPCRCALTPPGTPRTCGEPRSAGRAISFPSGRALEASCGQALPEVLAHITRTPNPSAHCQLCRHVQFVYISRSLCCTTSIVLPLSFPAAHLVLLAHCAVGSARITKPAISPKCVGGAMPGNVIGLNAACALSHPPKEAKRNDAKRE